MSDLRKKAMTRLVLCAVALVASIIFSVLLLTGNLDGQTGSGDATSVATPLRPLPRNSPPPSRSPPRSRPPCPPLTA